MNRHLLPFALMTLFTALVGCGSTSAGSGSFPAPAQGSASVSNTTFDFGTNLVGSTLTQTVTTIRNLGGSVLSLSPTLTGDSSYIIAPGQTCLTSIAANASCPIIVNYTPTAASGTVAQTATLNLGLSGVAAGTPKTVAVSGISAALGPAMVTATNNPQVALYTINLPIPGSVTVNFGKDTSYGRSTWTQSTAVAGPVSVLVAGMYASTLYHVQATLKFTNGLTVFDTDHTFTTTAGPAQPTFTATTTAGMRPSPGVEQYSALPGTSSGLYVTDLQGQLLWSYLVPGNPPSTEVEGATLLANGHFLITLGGGNDFLLRNTSIPAGAVTSIREIDLAGNIIHEITTAALSAQLTAAGYNYQLGEFHHDVRQLPNGHWLVLASMFKPYTDLTGYPGTTNVLGDVVIDLDTNFQPAWVWSEFDHLDVNRHPMLFPDWTHTNAVVYSPDDGNLLISMRHQNWVVKVDYRNGTGSGNILWHLGYQGDFTLVNGTDPTDWQYAQHYPSFFSTNTSGTFSLGLMDNGNERVFSSGIICGATGAPPCQYTTIPIFQINEVAKTATLTSHQILPTSLYSLFGGNTELLANGDTEYTLSDTGTNLSETFEVTSGSNPQTVWHQHIEGSFAYRGFRVPSLYPGVQW